MILIKREDDNRFVLYRYSEKISQNFLFIDFRLSDRLELMAKDTYALYGKNGSMKYVPYDIDIIPPESYDV